MTTWSTPALLLLGIAAGPYGLNLLTSSVLLLLDPGIAMTVAMLGIFVGLSVDIRQRAVPRTLAASFVRTMTTVLGVGAVTLAISSWGLSQVPVPVALPIRASDPRTLWLLALMAGVCAAVSHAAEDVNVDDVLMIVAGGLIVAAIRAPAPDAMLLVALAVAGISVMVALAGWLLVGQANSEGEQHVFVVGSLLLTGGAAAYLSVSAAFAGLIAGLTWNVAGNVAKARIVRDLNYFQHPLVVLVLITAGASATLSVEAMWLGAIFVATRAFFRSLGVAMARRLHDVPTTAEGRSSLISAGLVGIALAFDAFRANGRPEWAVILLGGVVIGTIGSEVIALFLPPRETAR